MNCGPAALRSLLQLQLRRTSSSSMVNRRNCFSSGCFYHHYPVAEKDDKCRRTIFFGKIGSLQFRSSLVLSRSFHSSSASRGGSSEGGKRPSKVVRTVSCLEEELEKARQRPDQLQLTPKKRPLYKRIKDEILHLYHGFRLLFIEVRICTTLAWRASRGKPLTRREHKQLVRTTSDLFRLVPFSVFIIIPFMELLLPFFIKLFPGLLPSTFQSTKDLESKRKAELKVKLEMAKFLQETLNDMVPQAKGHKSEVAKEFAEFIEKIRETGSEVPTDEILKFSKLFQDEITLDSLSRQQLLALCRVLEIPPVGTTAMLRFQLRLKLRNLKADDKVIDREGLDNLNLQELQNACKARGMRCVGVPEDRLKRQMRQWLALSLHKEVPASLLLLSRTMFLPDYLPATQQLQATLQALPDSTTLQTKAAIGEREGKIDNKTRIELIREEERKIQEELLEARRIARIQEARAAAEREQEELEEKTAFLLDEAAADLSEEEMKSLNMKPFVPSHDDHTVAGVINKVLFRTLPSALHTGPVYTLNDALTRGDFDSIENIIQKLSRDNRLLTEKEELRDLKAEISEYIEDIHELEELSKQAENLKIKVKESKGARRLRYRLADMVAKLDKQVESQERKTSIQKNLLATEELVSEVRKLKRDPEKLEKIAAVIAKLHNESDGKIEVDDLVRVIDVVGKEHTDLNSEQLEYIVRLLAKEESLGKSDSGNTTPTPNKPEGAGGSGESNSSTTKKNAARR